MFSHQQWEETVLDPPFCPVNFGGCILDGHMKWSWLSSFDGSKNDFIPAFLLLASCCCFYNPGVLLLNAVLTVRAHQANSHRERGWEQFTDAVVSWLNENLDGLVFMLWGAYAQKKGSSIDRVGWLLTTSLVCCLKGDLSELPHLAITLFACSKWWT